MTYKRLSNPQSFVKEAHSKNIRYEYLKDAMECVGKQEVARMFSGRSNRGSYGVLSAATIENWLMTFEFVMENPDCVDNEPYQSRSIEKNGDTWDKYVELIKKEIPITEVNRWKTLKPKKLSPIAIEHGITKGVENAEALKKLLGKMLDMYERRKKIWNVAIDNVVKSEEKTVNYNLKNVLELKAIAKERNIVVAKAKKTEIIALIEEDDIRRANGTDRKLPLNELDNNDEMIPNYSKMTAKEMKFLAQKRNLTCFNNLNRDALIELHKKYDCDEKMKKESMEKNNDDNEHQIIEYELMTKEGKKFVLPIEPKGTMTMVNATLLAKPMNKLVKDYLRLDSTKEYIEALKEQLQIKGFDTTNIIIIKQHGNHKHQGTWVHRKIAIHMAGWINPRFGVQMNDWIEELLLNGKVELQRPLRPVLSLTHMDVEAENLNLQYENNWASCTNIFVLYIAYIGNGLVKIGCSDCNLIKRISKHNSTESEYQQFLPIGAFRISSKQVEKTIHKLLDKYNFKYNKQVEIFKPDVCLTQFLNNIQILLNDNDLKLQLEIARKQLMENEIQLKELEIYKLKLQLAENKIKSLEKLIEVS